MAYPAKRKKESRKREVKGNIEAAKELAFRFLSYRSRSSEEVRQKLSQAGFAPSDIEGVIARLEELGYLNDYDYAFAMGRSWVEHKCWGPSRIRDALVKKGVATGDHHRRSAVSWRWNTISAVSHVARSNPGLPGRRC